MSVYVHNCIVSTCLSVFMYMHVCIVFMYVLCLSVYVSMSVCAMPYLRVSMCVCMCVACVVSYVNACSMSKLVSCRLYTADAADEL